VAVSYPGLLRLDELLALQSASDGLEHDELLVIVAGQVNELWFKQILHELKLLQLAMENSHAPVISSILKRVLTILGTLTAEIAVLETMSPVSFAALREHLDVLSCRQSTQLLEIEVVLGLRRSGAAAGLPEGSRARVRIERALGRHSLYDSFLRYLALLGYPIPGEILNRDLSHPHEPSPAVQESLIEIYRHDPGAWQICELMVDLAAAVREWRYRQAVMIERTAGEGDGGASGLAELRSGLERTAFPDLWAIRSAL
jgi:tryptophan 2,3-dioxygenase